MRKRSQDIFNIMVYLVVGSFVQQWNAKGKGVHRFCFTLLQVNS